MKRVLYGFGLAVAIAVGGWILVQWMYSDPIPTVKLEQTTSYDIDPAPTDQETFTVMTYNLGYLAQGSDPHSGQTADSAASARMNDAVDLIRQVDPDVIGLQEVTMGAAPGGTPHQLDTLARRLSVFATGGAVRRNERSFLPFSSGSLGSGQAILSRFPLRRHVRRELRTEPQSEWTVLGSTDPIVQVVAVGVGGWPLIVMNVNLDAAEAETRTQQAEEVNRLYRRLAEQGFPMILLGSAHGPSSSQENAQTVLRNEILDQLVEGTTLQPALSPEEALVTGQNVATYPSAEPTQKVDYIFYRPGRVVPIDAKTWCTDTRPPPSEHCAVSLSFYLPRPLDQLPDDRIPEDKLPSLDSLMNPDQAQ